MPDSPDFGPRPISLTNFILKTLAGVGGGVFGTLILFFIFFVFSWVIRSTFESQLNEIHPLFVFVFIAMIFLSSLGANIGGSLLLGLVDREHYRLLSSAIFQIFILNLLVFIILAPVYFILFSAKATSFSIFLAGFQILLAAQGSLLILKIISDRNYALMAVYSGVVSSLLALLFIGIVNQLSNDNLAVILIVALPILWTLIGLSCALLELISYFLYKLYGVDFLQAQTPYGRDVPFEDTTPTIPRGLSEEDEKMLVDSQEERGGVDFLRKKKS